MSDIRVIIAVEVNGSRYATETVTEPDWRTPGTQVIAKVGDAIDATARKVIAAVGAS